jgi:hypothetical protein
MFYGDFMAMTTKVILSDDEITELFLQLSASTLKPTSITAEAFMNLKGKFEQLAISQG